MPYLLVLHLLFGICVYGHPDFFASGVWLRLTDIKVKDKGTTKTVRARMHVPRGDLASWSLI